MALEKLQTVAPRTPAGMYLRFWQQRGAVNGRRRVFCWFARQVMDKLKHDRVDWYVDHEAGTVAVVGSETGQCALLSRGNTGTRAGVNASRVVEAMPCLLGRTILAEPYPALGPTALVISAVETDKVTVAVRDLPKRRAAGREAIRRCITMAMDAGIDPNPQELVSISKRYELTTTEARREAEHAAEDWAVAQRDRRMGK